MKIEWLGHSCFLITAKNGLRVITDPYNVGGGIGYGPVRETADVVLVSHDHGDHNNVSAVQGKPEVIRGIGARNVGGTEFRGVGAFHDASGGKQRGFNTVFCFAVDDVRLCHLGDLGHVLSDAEVEQIGVVDVLFIPVGGFYTVDASTAKQVCDQLRPKVVIPMHFKTAKCGYPIAGVEDFLKGKKDVRRVRGSEVELEHDELPAGPEIVVLQPAL